MYNCREDCETDVSGEVWKKFYGKRKCGVAEGPERIVDAETCVSQDRSWLGYSKLEALCLELRRDLLGEWLVAAALVESTMCKMGCACSQPPAFLREKKQRLQDY